MSEEQPNNPLHGLTLEAILTRLVGHYQWEGLAARIRIRCFSSDPSIKSSLVFLRRTGWARTKVETLYLRTNFAVPAPLVKKPFREPRATSASTPPGAKMVKLPHSAKADKNDRTPKPAQRPLAKAPLAKAPLVKAPLVKGPLVKAPRQGIHESKTVGPVTPDSRKQ